MTQKTKEDLKSVIGKREGHFRRVVIDALKKNRVDLQVYFSDVMNGEHCFKFPKNGKKNHE